ncbi:MAG: SIR2 family protein [Chloroflexi bacterium]|nr:SIR2 family protein [Chloroflexota bacterium]
MEISGTNKKKRTFLLGAGFSNAVADGPLMKDIWSNIEKVYEKEKKRVVSQGRINYRLKWFEKLESFIKELEEKSIENFMHYDFDYSKVTIKENIEYLFTLIDLHLSGAEVQFEKAGSDIPPYPAIPFSMSERELKERKSHLITFLYIVLEGLKGNNFADEFAGIIDEKSDEIITFNYDLVLEKALLNKNKWSPLGGYVAVNKFKNDNDMEKLERANMHSRIKIHKMHGSINWVNVMFHQDDIFTGDIFIELDNRER